MKCRSCVFLLRIRRSEGAISDECPGLPPKQVVCGLEEIPANSAQAFRDQRNAIRRQKLGLDEIAEMLQDTSSSRPTFICIDAVGECMAECRAKVLDSLKRIQKGLRTQGSCLLVILLYS